MRTTTDLLLLRWRAAQWLLACDDGYEEQARALRGAMRVEGIRDGDMIDESRLLRHQFGRQRYRLVDEINRLWGKIRERCTRCDRPSRHRDIDGVCCRCVLEESS